MRKFSVCMLAILLILIGQSALAEAASDSLTAYNTYTNTTFGYDLDYPSEWMQLDSETIDAYIEMLTSGDITMSGISSSLESLKSILSENVNNGFVEFMDRSGNNFNVACFEFPTPPSIEDAKATLAPQIIDVHSKMFTYFTILDNGSVYTACGVEFLRIQYQCILNDKTITMTLFYYFKDDKVFNFTFTWMTTEPEDTLMLDDILETVMNSVVFEP